MSRHLLIAGTGRAGTSFLVRYLHRLGLDTNLSRGGAAANWDDQANAGLEDMPLPDPGALPYVVKSPWTYQFIRELLANPGVEIDAIVVPMRDLTEAAASRSIVELQRMHSTLPWMSELEEPWEHIGHTPGGVIFSNNPVDQARLLAVGFHHLLDQAVKADIPVILLSFPRFVEDPDYLHRKLGPLLPASVSLDEGRAAHADTADAGKVRVGKEVRAGSDASPAGLALAGPGHAQLNRIALQRVLGQTRQELVEARSQSTSLLSAIEEREARTRSAQSALSDLTEERDQQARNARRLLDALTQERDSLRAALEAADATADRLRERLEEIQGGVAWRIAFKLLDLARRAPLTRRYASPLAKAR